MEVCDVLPGQPARMELNLYQRKNMSKVAIRPAFENAYSVANESQRMLKLDKQTSNLSNWQAVPGEQLIKVEGRVLSAPQIQYAGSPLDPKSAAWNLIRTALFYAIEKFLYGIFRLPTKRKPIDDAEFNMSLRAFQDEMPNLGLKSAQLAFDKQLPLQDTEQNALDKFANDLRQFFKEKGKAFYESPIKEKILLVVAPEDTRLFNRLKYELEVVLGIRSVYVVYSKFVQKGGDRQLMANLLMKWNLQLGGINQKLVENYGGLWGDGKTLFMGYDITHPSSTSLECAPSVAAYVANVSGDMAQFPVMYRCQHKDPSKSVKGKNQAEEPAKHLQEVMLFFIKQWFFKHNKTLPENIVVYRDGVSEGQFGMVKDDEAGKIRAAIEEARSQVSLAAKKPVAEIPNVAFAVAIVGKRHNVSLRSAI